MTPGYGWTDRQPIASIVAVIAVLVHSNLFIATAATGVAVTTTVLASHPLDPIALGIVFSTTLFVYSVNRVTDIEEDTQNVPTRAAFTQRYGRPIAAVGSLLYLGAVVVAVAIGLPMVEFLVLPLVAAVLYSVLGLKRVLLVKNLLVGIAWGIIPLGIGVYYGILWTVEILFLSGIVTVMITVAAAIFDIKDIEGDREAGVRTIPIVFGVHETQVFAAAVTLAVAATVIGSIVAGVVPVSFAVLLGFFAYVLAYIPFSSPDRGPLFYGFVVDGEHIFLAALVLLVG